MRVFIIITWIFLVGLVFGFARTAEKRGGDDSGGDDSDFSVDGRRSNAAAVDDTADDAVDDDTCPEGVAAAQSLMDMCPEPWWGNLNSWINTLCDYFPGSWDCLEICMSWHPNACSEIIDCYEYEKCYHPDDDTSDFTDKECTAVVQTFVDRCANTGWSINYWYDFFCSGRPDEPTGDCLNTCMIWYQDECGAILDCVANDECDFPGDHVDDDEAGDDDSNGKGGCGG